VGRSRIYDISEINTINSYRHVHVLCLSNLDTTSSESSAVPFKYTPLATDEIRLVAILTSPNFGQHIECSIKHTLRSSKPSYKALSYTWDAPYRATINTDRVSMHAESSTAAEASSNESSIQGEPFYKVTNLLDSNLILDPLSSPQSQPTVHITVPILVNGCEFLVRENLWQALRHLRTHNDPLVIWIDAICIDQSNIPERNSQVSIMDDIYRGAEEVCIWLGDSREDTPLALELLFNLAAASKKPEQFMKKDLYKLIKHCPDRYWNALEGNFRSSWWNRAWIFQEICLAQKAVVIYGVYRIPWKPFTDFGSIFNEFCEVESSVINRRDCVGLSSSVSAVFKIETDRKAMKLGSLRVDWLFLVSRGTVDD
jgi:hypothetical protein